MIYGFLFFLFLSSFCDVPSLAKRRKMDYHLAFPLVSIIFHHVPSCFRHFPSFLGHFPSFSIIFHNHKLGWLAPKSLSDSALTCQVRRSISHHTARLGGPWLPPTLPFLLTFDPRTRIRALGDLRPWEVSITHDGSSRMVD